AVRVRRRERSRDPPHRRDRAHLEWPRRDRERARWQRGGRDRRQQHAARRCSRPGQQYAAGSGPTGTGTAERHMSIMDKPHHRGISSLAIVRPIGTLMLCSVIVVLGVFFLARLLLDLLPTI